ncbi:MAG: hypothetical protein NVSMB57_00960 [Actinomycetota bacterium]
MTQIRTATHQDLTGLRAVDETFANAASPAWSLMSDTTFRFKIDSKTLLVAVKDGQLVGYLMWTLFWGFPFIEYIRVVQAHRNAMVGTKMLEALVAEVAERGYSVMWSSTQDADALRWHERNGFSKVGETTWVWGSSNEIVLMKELTEG